MPDDHPARHGFGNAFTQPPPGFHPPPLPGELVTRPRDIDLPIGAFGGFYGFRWPGRPALPDLGLVAGPWYAHFLPSPEWEGRRIRSVSTVGAAFESVDVARRAMIVLSAQAASVLRAENAASIRDLPPGDLGDEVGWGWTMTLRMDDEQLHRAEYGWRRGPAMLNVTVWGVEDVAADALPFAQHADAVAEF